MTKKRGKRDRRPMAENSLITTKKGTCPKIDYTYIRVPAKLREAIAILRQAYKYKTNSEVVVDAVRRIAVERALMLNDEQLDKITELVEQAEEEILAVGKWRLKHYRELKKAYPPRVTRRRKQYNVMERKDILK